MNKLIKMALLSIFVITSNVFAEDAIFYIDIMILMFSCEKFTAKTGTKVNVVSGKSGALEKE